MTPKVLMGMVLEYGILALTMFLAAGRLDWPTGWGFLVLMCGFSLSVGRMSAKRNPGLLEERLKVFQAGQKGWDRALIALIIPLRLAWLALTAMDAARYGWSHVPPWVQVAGLAGLLIALAIMYLTFQENAYLSTVVRLQEDRGQAVVSTGPYGLVRHPMYSAVLLQFPASTLLLGSWYSLVLALAIGVAFGVRASLEDRMLRAELDGYGDYANRVKYRLVPGVW